MRIVESKIIPFKGFKAINICGVVFHRKGSRPMMLKDIHHEAIHTEQMKEMAVVGFYLWYVIEWLIRLAVYRNARKAYRMIWFEREAYEHQEDLDYVEHRKLFAWLR